MILEVQVRSQKQWGELYTLKGWILWYAIIVFLQKLLCKQMNKQNQLQMFNWKIKLHIWVKKKKYILDRKSLTGDSLWVWVDIELT